MIVGTAGHIDHGKTTLVRALTGIDTDRLQEEKKRGISIELGYAYAPLPDGEMLGFVDVPGHERLVHTMVAGATGIDFGLLVVAADDGVMPQTREHLAVLALLGVQRGAIALTKAARADQNRIDQVRHDIAELTRGTFLQSAPVFVMDAVADGAPGVAALKDALQVAAGQASERAVNGFFRLAIDRVFTLQGHGTVVTGTVHSGVFDLASDGADIRLMPVGRQVRVRSLHAHNHPAQQAVAGQRCALNLGGLQAEAVARGNWVADARCFTPSHRVDVEMTLLEGADTPIRAWSPVHVHLGAAHWVAHAVPLEPAILAPGQTGLVQLVFAEAICAMAGDRYIVRNAQARETVGGGQVLDPNAPDRKRRSPPRLAWLRAVTSMLAGEGLAPLLAKAPQGVEESLLERLAGGDIKRLALPAGVSWRTPGRLSAARTLIADSQYQALKQQLALALDVFHETAPDEPGVTAGRLRRMAAPALRDALWAVLVEDMLAEDHLARTGAWLHRPGHGMVLSDEDATLAMVLLPRIAAGGFDPPWTRDLAGSVGEPEERVRQLLRRLVRRGDVFQVVHDLFYHRDQISRLAAMVATLDTPKGISAAQFRDATGLGRKRAIQILEFFDRVGYTRRLRDRHVLRGEPWAGGAL